MDNIVVEMKIGMFIKTVSLRDVSISFKAEGMKERTTIPLESFLGNIELRIKNLERKNT